MQSPFTRTYIGFEVSSLEHAFERQCRWAAKGGRGRKKPKRISAWSYLRKRKRGRPPKQQVAKATAATVRRKSSVDELDRLIISHLIREAPQRPELHIRSLIVEAVRGYDFGAFQHRSDGQHVRRILGKVDRLLPILRLPHKHYLIEKVAQ